MKHPPKDTRTLGLPNETPHNLVEYPPFFSGAPSIWFEYADGQPHRLGAGKHVYFRTPTHAYNSARLWAERYGYELDFIPDTNRISFVITLTRPAGAVDARKQRHAAAKARAAGHRKKVAEKRAKQQEADGAPERKHGPATQFWDDHPRDRATPVRYGLGTRFPTQDSVRRAARHYARQYDYDVKTRIYAVGTVYVTLTRRNIDT